LKSPPSCRLFVLVAREARVAVVLRRGPSAWYHVIRWDMATDRFEHGAWLRGRIYGDRCDVSPDGKLLLAFIHQGRRSGTSYTHAWTAVSRVPWLDALALWPQGTTYGSGGRFIGNREVVIRNQALATHPRHPSRGLAATSGNPPLHASSESMNGVDWAGRDHRGDVVFAREGRLVRCLPEGDVVLGDFNALTGSDPIARGGTRAAREEQTVGARVRAWARQRVGRRDSAPARALGVALGAHGTGGLWACARTSRDRASQRAFRVVLDR
jgi:hypothetical protein